MFFVKSFLCKCNNKMYLYKKFLCVLKLQSVTPLYNTACNPCKTIQTLFNVLNNFCVAKMFFVKSFLCKCNNKMHLFKKFLCVLKLQSVTPLYNTACNPCNTIQTLCNVLNNFCVAKMFFVKSFLCKCNNKMYLYKKFLCCTVKKVF